MKILSIIRTMKYGCYKLIGKAPNHSIDIKVKKTKHGSDYGGWVVAVDFINKSSIVYSIGIGTDVTFDTSMIESYGLKIYGYDPTPGSLDFVRKSKLPKEFTFFPYGISSQDRKEKFYLPSNPNFISHSKTPSKDKSHYITVEMKKISTVMKVLNHEKIDVLKMDIEGFEYEVIKNVLEENLDIKQILVEFHHGMYENINTTNTNEIVKLLRDSGYKIFNISPSVREYSFIKL